MTQFSVCGPIKLPIKKGATGALIVDKSAIKGLLNQHPELDQKGCYVFSCRGGRGAIPIYVGKTERGSLLSEAFNPRNLNLIYEYMNGGKRRGNIELFVLTQKRSRGKPNLSAISQIEEYLIANAAQRNKNLINKHGTKQHAWSIIGVYNGGRGRADATSSDFKKIMGL